jgi:hypothetical protein
MSISVMAADEHFRKLENMMHSAPFVKLTPAGEYQRPSSRQGDHHQSYRRQAITDNVLVEGKKKRWQTTSPGFTSNNFHSKPSPRDY